MDFRKVTLESINYLKSAGTAEQAKLYVKLTKSHRIAAQNVWFNQQCKQLKVIPSYININSNTHSRAANVALGRAKAIWLEQEIRYWFSVRDCLKSHLKILYTELVFSLHNIEFDVLDNKAREFASLVAHKKYLVQSRKLERLVRDNRRQGNGDNVGHSNGQQLCPHTFHQRVVNLSNVQFSNSEFSLLEKGLKYNMQPALSKKPLESLAVDSEIAIVRGKKDEGVKHQVALHIKQSLSSSNMLPNSGDVGIYRSLKNKVDRNDLVISKADKGNTVVILDRNSYDQKVTDIIQGSDFQQLVSDPTKVFSSELKHMTENVSYIEPNSLKYVVPMNPRAPMLYGLPKIHKINVPIRPVVSYIGAPAYGLSKHLNYLLKSRSNFHPKFSLKNSLDLIDKVKEVNLPHNAKLMSLDVESLFTNVPFEECLQILEGHFERQRVHPGEADELISLTRMCMEQNYFRFNNQYFKQKEGLAMGSPLSPLMADIFMDYFENKYFVGQPHILYYYRYVDDIIMCWTGTLRQIDIFVRKINNLHPKIKFTLELEVDKALNFLDLTVSRIDNRHDFQIYRKPTYTDVTIPESSCHPFQHKLAAYRSFIHRLMSVPLSQDNYNKELSVIYYIAESNGYNRNMIDGIIKGKRRNMVRSLLYPLPLERPQKYVGSLTYLGSVSDRVSKTLARNEIRVAFKTNNSLRQLCNGKDRLEDHKKSGVYKLVCDECNGIYVGQTGRNFQTRYKEHLAAYRNNCPERSHFAKHLIDTGHSLNNNHSFSILHTCNKGFRLSVLENLEIIKYNTSTTLFNELNTGLPRSPLLRIFATGSGESGGGGSPSDNGGPI